MRVLIFSIFLTFVGSPTAWAAPQTTLKQQTQNYEAQNDPYLAANKANDNHLPQYGTFVAGGGYFSGRLLEPDMTINRFGFHFRFTPLKSSWSYSLEQLESGIWAIGAGKEFSIRWETALRFSLNIISYKTGDAGGPFELKRWRVRTGWLIGDTWTIEPGVGLALTGLDVYLLMGYKFNF